MSIEIREDDLAVLLNLVRTGQIRELSGQNNNPANPHFGAADTPFTRLTSTDYASSVVPNGYVLDPSSPPGQPIYVDDPNDDIPTPAEIRDVIMDQEGQTTVADSGANAWFTAFGQYVDHGLDFVIKGGDGSIEVGDDVQSITRASFIDRDNDPNTPEVQVNNTAQFTDLSQAYGSHASMNAFLRDYEIVNGVPTVTARLLSSSVADAQGFFNLPSWKDVKDNALKIGVILGDEDVFDAPVLRTDEFGALAYTPDPSETYDTSQILGFDPNNQDPNDPFMRDASGNVLRSNQPFLIDFAPFAAPSPGLDPDANDTVNFGMRPEAGAYDNELLDVHFITGDGRGNENPGLTAVHTIWEREHNRLVDQVEAAFADNGMVLSVDYTADELFNVVKIINEAQYQRTIFNEFVDTMLGGISGSGQHGFGGYDPTVDPSVTHEFAGAAFRFGHSLLNGTFKFVDANGFEQNLPLANLFVNPQVLQTDGTNVQALIRGLTGETAQEVDEDIFGVMRDFVGGLNVARGRDLGLPTLNEVRAELFALTGDSSLKPYESWEEFGDNLVDPSALAAFQSVYATVDDVDLYIGGLAEEHAGGSMLGSTFHFIVTAQFDALQDGDRFYYLDRLDGMHLLSEINSQRFSEIVARNTGIENLPNDIFEMDSDDPSSGDVFVSDASPTEGQMLLAGNTLADEDVPDNMDVSYQWRSSSDGGQTWTDIQGATDAEFTPMQAQVGLQLQVAGTYEDSFGASEIVSDVTGIVGDLYTGTASANNPALTAGADIASGRGGNDTLRSLDGGDTLNGNGGNDRLEGGSGDDLMRGGRGRDTLIGGAGDDSLNGGRAADTLIGGAGDDTMNGGAGNDTFVFLAGFGNDTIAGFDAVSSDGQDLLDLSQLGITEDLFAAEVDIGQSGADAVVTLDEGAIRLAGVAASNVTQNDFLFA